MFWLRKVTLISFGIALVSCSPDEPEAWKPAEMSHLVKQFGHIAEAYAVLDLCMPRIESDRDAQRALTEMIGIRSYTQLLGMDTDAELERFLAYHKNRGGSSEQHASLEQVYQDSYEGAQPHLRTLDICVETVSDYANTLLHTRVTEMR